jgi:GntR family transcriptional repressor for pyruvate dehydrogenase complex
MPATNALAQLQPIDGRTSASERVAERLKGLISSGNLAAGDKLPSENQLSKALHVSRPVIREALRGLAMMGIVESRQGGGCYVTDLTPNRLLAPLSYALSLQDYSFESLFRAREVIDTGLTADAARNASDAQIALMREMVVAGHRLVEDPIGFRLMDAEFHELIGQAARSEFLDHMSRSLYTLAMEHRRKASAVPGVLRRSAADHAAITEAIARHDPDAAAAAMAIHVANIRETTFAVMASAAPGLAGDTR